MSSMLLYNRLSITFPCIGAGTLKYPPEALSKIMVDYIRAYLSKLAQPSLTVNICVYEKDQHLIDVSSYSSLVYSPS